MSVAVSKLQNFIGGEWVDAAAGDTMEVVNPATNDHIPLVSEMPHGGFKQSGNAKDLSTYSLEDYTQVKHVMANLG